MAGTLFGPYEISAQIGKGGMGEVYRALDTNLRRAVAIKILPDTFAHDPDRLARFEREAKTLATLNHPNIAQIYGLERSGPAPAFVMELVEGPTLAERVAAGPIAVHEALTIASQIAEALEAAHKKGIVHRDLKPTNISFASDGRVKVLDFGLAKTFDAHVSMTDLSQAATVTAGSTQAGVVLGTLAYMSPEQARGKAIDTRTDVWAFGCVLYELLTGRAPFGGETMSDVIVSVLERDPNWDALPQKTPSRVRELLGRCLEKNDRYRLRNIGDARLELKEVLEREESTSSSQGTARISVESMPTQDIRYCRIADGIALAYSTIGKGYPLVMVPHWMSHLEADFRNPLTRHYWEEFSKRYRLIRYDTRGYGLSDRVMPDGFDAFVTDLDAVTNALQLDRFALLGPSGGASVGVAYAARHAERVSHLILLGGFIRGPRRIGDPAGVAFADAIDALIRVGWGQSSSRFRNVFCSMLVPDGTPEQYKWMDDAQLAASSAEYAERYFKILSDVDLSEEAARITTPTLVFHGAGDTAVPFSEAQYTAARIPNARLVPLPTKNHHLLADEPAWTQFLEAVDEFVPGNTSRDRFAGRTDSRE